MQYAEVAPPADLANDIECIWSLRAARTKQSTPPDGVYPDGCIELIVHLDDRFVACASAEARERQPSSFVVGPMTRPLFLVPGGGVDTVGIRFRPGAASAWFPMPLHRLADRVTPLDALWGSEARRFEETLASQPTHAARARVVATLLRARRRDRRPPWIQPAVTALVAAGGNLPVHRLSSGLARSARQVERAFLEHVGHPPKELARIVRFQSVFRRVRDLHSPGWIDVALDCGYFDQSHLIRDFTRLAGRTPRDHATGAGALTRLFTSADRLAGYFRGA